MRNATIRAIVIGLGIVLILTGAFFAGGPLQSDQAQVFQAPALTAVLAKEKPADAGWKQKLEQPEAQSEQVGERTPTEPPADEPEVLVPDQIAPSEPEQSVPTASEPTVPETPEDENCTISISCAVLTDQLELLPEEKRDLVPSDGWILKQTAVDFTEGESVFDMLQRVTREQKIHLEASFTPVYDSSYVEGIGNLYEFDAGPLSGWTYTVNGAFVGLGSSQVAVESGDVICWMYTCDLGKDVGGGEGV